MKRSGLLTVLLLSVFLSLPVVLSAHPHVFISTRVTVHLSDQGIQGFGVSWLFDDMFSSMIIGDFDADRSGSFSPAEIESIRTGAFANLKNFHYFTYVEVEGKERPLNEVQDFRAAIHSGTLEYAFFVPVRVPVGSGETSVTVAAYDESYYCDMAFDEDQPLVVQNGGPYRLTYNVVKNTDNSFYFGQITPFELHMSISKK
jgi:ABC-type uncharacterized transport system substrate-binding protein